MQQNSSRYQTSRSLMNLFDPIVPLTGGLVLFAAAQVGVAWRAECKRRAEREADEQRALDLAYQAVWAEHFRLDSLADQWEESDLVELSLLGLLRPQDVLPEDGQELVRLLARLSVEAGYFGGVALTLANDVARQIALLNVSTQGLAMNASLKDRVGLVRGLQGSAREEGIRKGLRDLSLLLWDALQQSPNAGATRTLTFTGELKSEIAQKAVAALTARATKERV